MQLKVEKSNTRETYDWKQMCRLKRRLRRVSEMRKVRRKEKVITLFNSAVLIEEKQEKRRVIARDGESQPRAHHQRPFKFFG